MEIVNMSQRLITSWINTVIPGAYDQIIVKSNPVGLGSSGNVVIIGEADGGPSYSQVALKDNSFTPDQLDKVTNQYVSGQIVDAFRAFSAPSNDPNITGTANRIWIVKTNTSAKASAIVDTDYGTLEDINFGKAGNQYKFTITQVAAEAAPSVQGSTIAAFGAPLNGTTFNIRLNGGASTAVTLSATASDHSTISALIIELNSLLPSGITASSGTASNSLKLALATNANANRDGFGRSFELIDSTPGDLAALGLAADLYDTSQEPSIEISIVRTDIGLNSIFDIESDIAFTMGYSGTTATVTINQTTKTLTTTVTGGSGSNLSVDLTSFRTIADLATYIAAQPGYSASASAAAQQLSPSALDAVSAVGAASATFQPARIKKAAYNFQKAMATSSNVEFVPTAKAGLPKPSVAAFLAGGSRGATLAADVVNAVNQLSGINVNMVIPLFSQDASEDISDGSTDSSSTYTIAAINALVKNHCIQFSQPELKRNRICFLSFWGAYSDAKASAQMLANYRCSQTMQKVSQVDSFGNVQSFLPWYAACIAAGMQAGGFYKAIVNKFANVLSFQDPEGFDSGSPGDVEDALEAGLLFLTRDTAGDRWVSDQTTYGFDTNFIYNSIQAVYAADLIALDLVASFQQTFVGQSLADVDAATALSYLGQKMAGYRSIKLIAGSDDAPLGFKNAKVSISAPTMEVAVEIKLATAIYFIPISITISQIQQNAG
jgi:hypothetical protein